MGGIDMPLYNMKCKKCGETHEIVCKHEEVPKNCPICGSKKALFIKIGNTSWHFRREYTGRSSAKTL